MQPRWPLENGIQVCRHQQKASLGEMAFERDQLEVSDKGHPLPAFQLDLPTVKKSNPANLGCNLICINQLAIFHISDEQYIAVTVMSLFAHAWTCSSSRASSKSVFSNSALIWGQCPCVLKPIVKQEVYVENPKLPPSLWKIAVPFHCNGQIFWVTSMALCVVSNILYISLRASSLSLPVCSSSRLPSQAQKTQVYTHQTPKPSYNQGWFKPIDINLFGISKFLVVEHEINIRFGGWPYLGL